jgi:hypothetical protein
MHLAGSLVRPGRRHSVGSSGRVTVCRHFSHRYSASCDWASGADVGRTSFIGPPQISQRNGVRGVVGRDMGVSISDQRNAFVAQVRSFALREIKTEIDSCAAMLGRNATTKDKKTERPRRGSAEATNRTTGGRWGGGYCPTGYFLVHPHPAAFDTAQFCEVPTMTAIVARSRGPAASPDPCRARS